MSSRVILGTNRFDAMVTFYRYSLGLPQVDCWDEPERRGVLLQLPGTLLEIYDNDRERIPRMLGASLDRVSIVIEVEDIDMKRDRLDIETPTPNPTTCGGKQFQLRDPDGLPITFLQTAMES